MSLDRRTLLTTSAAAGLLATDRTSFAQAQPQRASVPNREPSASDTVKLDRLDSSILLIGIDRPSAHNTIDPSTFLGLGRAYYLLDHDESLRVGVLYAKGADFVTGLDGPAWESALRGGRFNPGTQEFIEPLGTVPPRREKPLVVAVHGKTQTIGHEVAVPKARAAHLAKSKTEWTSTRACVSCSWLTPRWSRPSIGSC